MSEFCCKGARIGTRGRKRMPHSEVCMHMRVAGEYLDFEVVGTDYPMVQLFIIPQDGDRFPRFSRPFSAAILLGEAGLFDNQGHGVEVEGETPPFYYYPHEYRDGEEGSDAIAEVVIDPVTV